MATMIIKPRDEWTREDLIDYLDGWHEECGVGFGSRRNGGRVVAFIHPDAVRPTFDVDANNLSVVEKFARDQFVKQWIDENTAQHPAELLIQLGKEARIAHREATGI